MTVACASFGAATSLGGVNARTLGAGAAAVASCDSDGVGISYTTSGTTVTDVTVTGVAAACTGGMLRVVLANASGTSIGAGGPVAVAGTSVPVTLSPQPTASNVGAAHISITLP